MEVYQIKYKLVIKIQMIIKKGTKISVLTEKLMTLYIGRMKTLIRRSDLFMAIQVFYLIAKYKLLAELVIQDIDRVYFHALIVSKLKLMKIRLHI